jgi:Holliday junction resolvase
VNSREKGKRGEREFAKVLNDSFGLTAKRGVQYQGSAMSPDVVGSWAGTHPEVKRVEDLDLDKAVEQAVRDAGLEKVPYVAHRKNGQEWKITVRLKELKEFVQRVLKESKQT